MACSWRLIDHTLVYKSIRVKWSAAGLQLVCGWSTFLVWHLLSHSMCAIWFSFFVPFGSLFALFVKRIFNCCIDCLHYLFNFAFQCFCLTSELDSKVEERIISYATENVFKWPVYDHLQIKNICFTANCPHKTVCRSIYKWHIFQPICRSYLHEKAKCRRFARVFTNDLRLLVICSQSLQGSGNVGHLWLALHR